ncbi:YihY/virulence factor BrkB family protein [Balneola sp. MJW-20]|uniref:YihY/virulence factor BrkB family protein n=1 Tax=Gracilimonas aurantiaca TaxID=3234185 RepID=UPI003464EE87
MQNFKDFWNQSYKLISRKDVFFNASAVTFNLFICAIPFLLILLSILGYILSVDEAFNELVRYGQELFPNFTYESQSSDVIKGPITIETILRPLVGAREAFGIAGIVILLFFTQGLIHSLKHVLFDSFDIEERKHPIMDAVYNFLAFGLLGTVFLFFSLSVSVVSLLDLDDFTIPFTEVVINLPWIYDVLNIILPIILTFFIQYVVFRFISERKIRPQVAVMGAATYTLLFEGARFGLSTYLNYAFSAYRFFYQGYTILVIISIWIFYSALLFVLATLLARAYKDVYVSNRPTIEENPYNAIS